MRAREFVNESKANGKIRKDQAKASLGIYKARDVGGYDRIYHMNRLTMAMSMADGKSLDAVEMDASSFAEKYNTVHPYTQEEYNMFIAASKTIPTEKETIVPYSRSKESSDTHIKSAVLTAKRFKFK
jgi:hypothetical protein